MAHILREIGWDAQTLPGGYKAYRKWVVQQLEILPQQFDFQVVHGPTGSGKSRLLAALARAGAQVLDLEALAAHRGSVLGGLPDRPQPSQKMFESLLLKNSRRSTRRSPSTSKASRRRSASCRSPEALIARMRALARACGSRPILETRVTLLLDEYRHFLEDRRRLEAQLDCLGQPAWPRERSPTGRRSPRAAPGANSSRACSPSTTTRRTAAPRTRTSSASPTRASVRIASADEAAFSRAAQSLLASAELQPA